MDHSPFRLFSKAPGNQKAAERQGVLNAAAQGAVPIRILIIEDEEAHFQLMKRAICKDRPAASVICCHGPNPEDCLEELENIAPDIILVDYLMPGMNGLEFLAAVKLRGFDIPVIMITGQGDENIAVKAMKLGAQDYLVKSTDFFLLLPSVIDQVVRERKLELDLQKVARLNELLLASLPYPAMMIRRDRFVLAANQISREMGARVGDLCWQGFKHNGPDGRPRQAEGECSFCRANDVFKLTKTINVPDLAINDRVWDVWWIPIDNEVCLHYAVDITKRKQAENELRVSSRFLEIANRHTDMRALLQDFVQELKILTGCVEVAVWVFDHETDAPLIASEGCNPQLLAPTAEAWFDQHPSSLGEQPGAESQSPAASGEKPSSVHAENVPASHGESSDPSAPPFPALFPVRRGERILGCVYLAGARGDTLPADRIENVPAAAMRLATAVERIQAREQLRESEQALRRLSDRLMTAQEEERTRISRELHDSIGSSLCAMRLSMMNILRGRQNLESLEETVSMTQNIIDEVRNIISDLRPAILDDLGIIAALKWCCRQFQDTHSDIEVEQHVRIREAEVPERLKIVILRIVQEALHNISKYSRAHTAKLELAQKKGALRLSISDDGIGFSPGAVSSGKNSGAGIGLVSMKERTELFGGTFHLTSRKGRGTTIIASWPLF